MCWYTAQWQMLLFCVENHCEGMTQFELAHVEEEEEEKQFGHLTTFWFNTFVMFFSSHWENRGTVSCYKGL